MGPTITPEEKRDRRPIFLSFRQHDSRVQAVRLYKDLRLRPGDEVIFDFLFDPVDWVGQLIETVRRSALILVLIGPKWLEILTERSAHGETFSDAVHIELLAAFQHRVPLLAVLVEGASPPTPSSLPPEVSQLADMPSVRLRASSWQQDLDGIVEAIERYRLAT